MCSRISPIEILLLWQLVWDSKHLLLAIDSMAPASQQLHLQLAYLQVLMVILSFLSGSALYNLEHWGVKETCLRFSSER